MVSHNKKTNDRYGAKPPTSTDTQTTLMYADAEADRQWYAAHPDQPEFRRPITLLEQISTGLPPSTIVFVRMSPDGMRVRAFSANTPKQS